MFSIYCGCTRINSHILRVRVFFFHSYLHPHRLLFVVGGVENRLYISFGVQLKQFNHLNI